MKEKIEFTEFLEIEKKLEIKIGRIVSVTDIPKSDKLLKLEVDFGEETPRIVVTNIKQYIGDSQECVEVLTGLSFPFITNLKPAKMMGIESTAMIMPGEIERGITFMLNARPGIKLL
jgi:methionyl-tRNA synthetase